MFECACNLFDAQAHPLCVLMHVEDLSKPVNAGVIPLIILILFALFSPCSSACVKRGANGQGWWSQSTLMERMPEVQTTNVAAPVVPVLIAP
jgi:hypothetical protein